MSARIMLLCLTASVLYAQHPSLYFTSADTAELRSIWHSREDAFPQNDLKHALVGAWPRSDPAPPADTNAWADYDRAKAFRAKALAFRYLMDRDDADARLAFFYLETKYAADGYIYQADNYARWMTNGLALIDYCAAYDLLAGAGYFNGKDGRPEGKDAIVRHLREKAAALYARVSTPRSGSEAFAAQVLGRGGVLNEVKFHAQIGNHRIITAAALGVAAYALRSEVPRAETDAWLAYARRDVGQFLLNRNTYPKRTADSLAVWTQNAGGAFPEGMEYLNYSAEGFVPFIIASKANGGEDYAKDPELVRIMDWVWDVQLPDGSAPQINSTGYGIFPINSLFALAMPERRHYLAQMKRFAARYGIGSTLAVEAFCLLARANKHIEGRSIDPDTTKESRGSVKTGAVTVTTSGGSVVMRDRSASPERYLLISTKHGEERFAAELHGYADAGSFIFGTERGMLVRHPGYAGYSASRELESAQAHNTITPVVNGTRVFDRPDRSIALPPSADARVLSTSASDYFSYAHIAMDVNGPKPVSWRDILSQNSSILSLPYEYISSHWMASRVNMERYGAADRRFLLVNGGYLVIDDRVVRTDKRMTHAVAAIHGNNGNRKTRAEALHGTTTAGEGDVRWSSVSAEELHACTAAPGGRNKAFSGFEASVHQSPDPAAPDNPRAIYYHAAYTTAAPFIRDTARIVSILAIEPGAGRMTMERLTGDADSSSAIWTVDGGSATYGRFDIVVSRRGGTSESYICPYTHDTLRTDAALLVVSFRDGTMDANGVRIFSSGATFISFGRYRYTPDTSGDAQTSFRRKALR